MIHRMLKLSQKQSFFLFGARGVGKSTLIQNTPFLKHAVTFDLLDFDTEEELTLRPQGFFENVSVLPQNRWVVIDEVQKIPALLDIVHSLIEKHKIKFSSSWSLIFFCNSRLTLASAILSLFLWAYNQP